jgi:hypothetical protein
MRSLPRIRTGCASYRAGSNGISPRPPFRTSNDRSYTAVFDANRRIGNHFSSYLHMEIPAGSAKSEYGSTPYSAATSVGVRFQL